MDRFIRKQLLRIVSRCHFLFGDTPLHLKVLYYLYMGKKLNLKNPKTLNEKMQWLKLYDRKPEYTYMVDKITAKDYVANKLGKEYVVPLLGVWDKPEDIDFDSLPNQFALKVNHGWQMHILVEDKDYFLKNKYKEAKEKFKKWLKINYEHYSLEPQYRNITPRIFAEYLRKIENLEHISDHKVYCFNGEPKFIEHTISYDLKNPRCSFHDTNWNKLPFAYYNPPYEGTVEKPENLEKMIEISKKLSEEFSFVRVDFSITPKELHIGEMTFTPASAMMNFSPSEYNKILGDMIKLPI